MINHYQTYNIHYCLIITNSWDTELHLKPQFFEFSQEKQRSFLILMQRYIIDMTYEANVSI